MSKPYYRPASFDDVPAVAADLRSADAAEITACTGAAFGHLAALDLAMVLSEPDAMFTICNAEGEPVALFGVAPSENDTAYSVWMVATNKFPKIATRFLRECVPVIEELNRKYPLLFNYVDARNTAHIRWLKWCGFKIINKKERYGVEQRPFYEFIRVASEDPTDV